MGGGQGWTLMNDGSLNTIRKYIEFNAKENPHSDFVTCGRPWPVRVSPQTARILSIHDIPPAQLAAQSTCRAISVLQRAKYKQIAPIEQLPIRLKIVILNVLFMSFNVSIRVVRF